MVLLLELTHVKGETEKTKKGGTSIGGFAGTSGDIDIVIFIADNTPHVLLSLLVHLSTCLQTFAKNWQDTKHQPSVIVNRQTL